MSNPFAALASSGSSGSDSEEEAPPLKIARVQAPLPSRCHTAPKAIGPSNGPELQDGVSGAPCLTKSSRAQKRRLQKVQKRAQIQTIGPREPPNMRVQKAPQGLSGRVAKAFEAGNWDDALNLLEKMRQLRQVPKLGALQRWVAGLGDGATTQPRALRLLEAILRVATGLGVALQPEDLSKAPLCIGVSQFNYFSSQGLEK